ncbi:M15 family metallopeptidase [Listeria seeligeri]|uniref:M15 family metallopeptidase n=1 Tax=Listeria seeligeri TaxID=1640 RepID=UPI0022EAE2BC|nr:M15 family metallopeptidase [Listeria seeligeri]
MTLYYEERSRNNIAKLATNTRKKAREWFDWCCENGIEILVYETIRTKAQQSANVANGKSQTMRSYHIVGQAFDFVMTKGKTVDWSGYKTATAKKAIAKAKSLGFSWGGDWSGFVDCPHMQYEYKGYGTDKFTADTPTTTKKTGKQGVYARGNLNIRTKATWDSTTAFKVPVYYYAQILWDTKQGDWVQIEFQGKKGWYKPNFKDYWFEKDPCIAYICTADVNFRKSSKWDSPVAQKKKKGDTVRMVKKAKNGWLEFGLTNGVIGYILNSTKYVKKK